jgi:hypothetical protein
MKKVPAGLKGPGFVREKDQALIGESGTGVRKKGAIGEI